MKSESRTGNPETAASRATERQAALRHIIAEVMSRRSRGEVISDAEVLSAHPDLAQDLVVELAAVRDIRRALVSARKAGVLDEPLKPLTASRLDEPIEVAGDDEEPILPPSPHIKGYTILSPIGSGSQGTVYKAIHQATERKVAIKVMPGGPLTSFRHRARFDQEVKVLATIEHPHIVKVTDRGVTAADSFFFAMDYVEGEDLDEFWSVTLGSSADDLRRLLETFVKICRAVHEAHRQRVVHRELKPSNIRIDRYAEPRVLDFGLALVMDPKNPGVPQRYVTLDGQMVGSLAWCSPEQIGRGTVDARTDVYAIGVMLYQAVAGAFPYAIDGPLADALGNIRSAPPSSIRKRKVGRARHVTAELEAVIFKALEKDPDQRYASVHELAEDLVAVLAGELPTAAKPPEPKRFPVLAAALLILAVSGGAAAWMWRGHASVAPATYTVFPLPTMDNSLGMRLIKIPAGEFLMGSAGGEPDRYDDEMAHRVRLTKPFFLGETEVTGGQYATVMQTSSPPEVSNEPVTDVSWFDAKEFCRRLSQREHRVYRLPTEAEWEYACRVGIAGPVAGTGNLEEMAWYASNSGSRRHAIATKKSNQWGLDDMQGNVKEWCEDAYTSTFPSRLSIDPLITGAGWMRVVRGGGFDDSAADCRPTRRLALSQNERRYDLGFRIVAEP